MNIFVSEHFFHSLTFLKKVKQSISHNISFFLKIINLNVVLQELLGLAGLKVVQVFCIYELAEIVIIGKNKNLKFAAF